AERGLRLPGPVPLWRHVGVRFQLYWVSTLFLLGLLSINFILWVLRRFNIRFALLEEAHAAIYDYVGDVKLYQDHYLRWDQAVEVIGEHSRGAIRRRVIRAVVRTAAELDEAERRGEAWDGSTSSRTASAASRCTTPSWNPRRRCPTICIRK